MKQLIFLISFVLSLSAGEPITPIKPPTNINIEKSLLGKKLFFDTRLSQNNTISCATCHNLEKGGDDNLQFSFGIHGEEGSVNAPTVFNAVNNFRQFWDGRAKDLQDQAVGPIENPIEMGYNFDELITRLNATEYKSQFSKIYSEGITKNSITDAIAEYEKILVTPNAPFDKYLKGDKNAISAYELEGYELFKAKGCISCHHGVNVGGNLYSKFGVVESPADKWLGRYNVTHKKRDKHYFKVPSLRNIAKTAPYFHDGSVKDLKDAIAKMAQLQLGRFFEKEDINKIEAFLRTLNGEIPKGAEVYVP
jgi:cytochrome c peroxidase